MRHMLNLCGIYWKMARAALFRSLIFSLRNFPTKNSFAWFLCRDLLHEHFLPRLLSFTDHCWSLFYLGTYMCSNKISKNFNQLTHRDPCKILNGFEVGQQVKNTLSRYFESHNYWFQSYAPSLRHNGTSLMILCLFRMQPLLEVKK